MDKPNESKINHSIIDCIKNLGISDENGNMPKEFNSYISNFGASIIQSDLKSAVAFFENEKSNTNEERHKIPELVLKVLKILKKNEEDEVLKKSTKLSEYVKESINIENTKADILEAATAIKYVMRLFKLVDGKKGPTHIQNNNNLKQNNSADNNKINIFKDTNMGYIYYKESNKFSIDNSNINKIKENSISKITGNLGTDSFNLKTTYPGLLIGSGNNHCIDVEKSDNEFKLGFEFDYTTGQPIINGSSVKGLIRSAFELDKEYLMEELNERYPQKHIDKKYKDLVNEIFEGIYKDENGREINIPVKYRDVFFDSYIVGMSSENHNVLGEDYITYHGDNELKNPIPIKFLKIMPNVEWKFSFKLRDTFYIKDTNKKMIKKEYILNAKEKLQLFKEILMDFGIGAKTNLGYGTLVESETVISYERIDEHKDECSDSLEKSKSNNYSKKKRKNPVSKNSNKLKKSDNRQCTEKELKKFADYINSNK